ncbi:hypothetical protein ACLMJK_002328 [Lecanora helva]
MPTAEEAAELPPLNPLTSRSIIIEEPECMIPEENAKEYFGDKKAPRNALPPKQYRTSSSRRLSGRPTCDGASPSLHSISSLSSIGSISTVDPTEYEKRSGSTKAHHHHHHHHVRHYDRANRVVSQVIEWLHNEKARKAARKAAKHGGHGKLAQAAEVTKTLVNHISDDESNKYKRRHEKSGSDVSEGSLALEELDRILSGTVDIESGGLAMSANDMTGSHFLRHNSKPKRQGSKKKMLRKQSTVQSSDAEFQDSDINVPSAEVVLDNSKTLGYSGGVASSEVDLINPSRRPIREKEAWLQFKHEIVRLTHTLRLKGWRRLPLEKSSDIDVERLSGAMTNAVYVVSPPSNFSATLSIQQDTTGSLVPRKPPPKLLLRIYGPQVEHLIDRESELQILCRLARKRIGPCLLGTFTNGRFEQFFNARTLTANDLRIPETSKQIAKRMRELHDGIELLEEERDAGAFIWRNWDKWKDRCEEVISYLDSQILADRQNPKQSRSEDWKKHGLVCGVEWSVFRSAVRQYRDWLFEQYGGPSRVRQHLVFSHNDTQYGNLLRLEPSGESPLLLPANEHKRLVVIDFEYASANVPGLEFANHFTEWCYNYHEPKSYALNARRYPTPEEQYRFFKAYIQHVPPIQTRPTLSPTVSATPGPTSSISSFVLDSRAPPAQIVEEEKQRDEALEAEIQRLSRETRIWRVANSAQWVAWGIVQAKVPGMDEALEAQKHSTPKSEETIHEVTPHLGSDPLSPENAGLAEDAADKRPEGSEEAEDEEEEFDYLGYAQERAMFFWGDVLQLGIVKRGELPEELLEKVKIVEY